MLFKTTHLKGIKNGTITLAFRKWKSARAVEGSIIKTPIGQVEIQKVSEVKATSIKKKGARAAGYQDLAELLKILNSRKEGDVYKIKVSYHSADPRIALRENDQLGEEEFLQIKNKLQRLDKYSKQGAWTQSTLLLIQKHPKRRAADLSEIAEREKQWLKINIRKLKNLGLTISHEVGYSLSPRGEVVLKFLKIQ